MTVLTTFSHVRHFFKILKLSGTLTNTYSYTYFQALQLIKQSVQAVTSRIVLSLNCLILTFQSMCMSQKLITPHNWKIPRKQFFFLLPELPSIMQIYLTRMKDRFFHIILQILPYPSKYLHYFKCNFIFTWFYHLLDFYVSLKSQKLGFFSIKLS